MFRELDEGRCPAAGLTQATRERGDAQGAEAGARACDAPPLRSLACRSAAHVGCVNARAASDSRSASSGPSCLRVLPLSRVRDVWRLSGLEPAASVRRWPRAGQRGPHGRVRCDAGCRGRCHVPPSTTRRRPSARPVSVSRHEHLGQSAGVDSHQRGRAVSLHWAAADPTHVESGVGGSSPSRGEPPRSRSTSARTQGPGGEDAAGCRVSPRRTCRAACRWCRRSCLHPHVAVLTTGDGWGMCPVQGAGSAVEVYTWSEAWQRRCGEGGGRWAAVRGQ